MERLMIERVGGLDVHKQTVAACAPVPGSRKHASSTYGPLGRGRRRSCACAIGSEPDGVTHVALESTGVYWKPIHYVLEESFACLLVKPRPCERGPRPQGQTQTSWWSWLEIGSGPNSRRCTTVVAREPG